MKKMAIAFAAALVLAAAMPTFAVIPTMKLNGEYTITNGVLPPAGANDAIEFSVAGGEAGGWSAEAELDRALNLGEYKAVFTDPLFNVTFWGKGKELNDKKVAGTIEDPFGFISSSDLYTGNMKVRAIAGPATVDFEDNGALRLFGEQNIAGHTVGIAAQSFLPLSNGVTVFGHDAIEVSGVTLTGGVGTTFKTGQAIDATNLGFGVKAEVPVPVLPNVTATVGYKSQPTGFTGLDEDALFVEGEHESDLMKVSGGYTHTIKTSDRSVTLSDKISATAYWRGGQGNQDWDDQFDPELYYKNVAPAAYAEVTYTMQPSLDPETMLTAKGTMPVLPNQLWVNGSLISELRDKKNTVTADAYYQMLPKLAIEPGARIVMEQGEDTLMDLSGKATYQVSTNGKMTAGYTVNTVAGEKTGDKVNFGYEVKL